MKQNVMQETNRDANRRKCLFFIVEIWLKVRNIF